jgi:hypothetical protein
MILLPISIGSKVSHNFEGWQVAGAIADMHESLYFPAHLSMRCMARYVM